MGVMTNAFLQQVDAFIEQHRIPVVPFRKGQRKDDVAAEQERRLRLPVTRPTRFSTALES